MLRPPRARGPHSARPWYQPTTSLRPGPGLSRGKAIEMPLDAHLERGALSLRSERPGDARLNCGAHSASLLSGPQGVLHPRAARTLPLGVLHPEGRTEGGAVVTRRRVGRRALRPLPASYSFPLARLFCPHPPASRACASRFASRASAPYGRASLRIPAGSCSPRPCDAAWLLGGPPRGP